MISLIFSIGFFLLFIFLSIAAGNIILRSMIDNVLSKSEKFQNKENNKLSKIETFQNNYEDNIIVNPIDDCKKIDLEAEKHLNFQTATNIPLSPHNYKNYIGSIYMNDNIKSNNELKDGMYCLKKSKLLYDGIWDPVINKDSPYEYESWKLTDSIVSDDYYCSDKLIEINKPFPKNYIDESATPKIGGGYYYTYFNDKQDDIFDTEIQCFPQIFNEGIY
jgi:hypothetical protein